jgi:type IV pilus assembly protein PilQ
MTAGTSRLSGSTVRWLLVTLLLPITALANDAAAPARLESVTISEGSAGAVVRIKTSSPVRYQAELIDTPYRVVVDLEDTVYAWRSTPLDTDTVSVRQIRGSQYRKGIARVVVELKSKAAYDVREEPDGLALVVHPGAAKATATAGNQPRRTVAAATVTAAPGARVVKPTAVAAATTTPTVVTEQGPNVVPGAPSNEREPRTEVTYAPLPGATPTPEASPAPGAVEPPPATLSTPADAVQTAPKPVRSSIVAQAPAPPPATETRSAPEPPQGRITTTTNGQRLISLDFKEADIVNLLRILAAESARNIVIGDDVKGKMSISLRNVPWDLALETILEARGLSKVERGGVIRIVSNDQLAKEREGKARIEEAKLKSEAELRAKIAEAQVKEAEALTRKLQAEVAQKEQEAKGPLREETMRLSYADPEEVAKTLQGILGIPAEGAKVTGPGFLGIPGSSGPGTAPNPELGIPYGGPQGGAASNGIVSVSQDVLNKGLTIRAHKPTNTLFLRLYSADLDRVKKIIRESLDIPLPQVKIEARMEILERNALEQIGVQWGGMVAQPTGNTTLVGQGLQTTTVGGQTIPFIPGRQVAGTTVIDPAPFVSPTLGNRNVFFRSTADDIAKLGGFPVSFQTGLPLGGNLVNLPISALPNSGPLPAAGLSFGIIGTRFNVNLALQALASQGKTRTLARPEVVTVENNKASISLGEELPYATISSAGTQIQFKEALLKLDVTPTVIKEGQVTRIKLVVVVENNSRGDTVNLGNAGSPPAINRRKAETQVLIKEGDRLIIGGVTTGVNQATTRKVPLFGDIPILGYLFKQKENFETGRELVVFLTPTLVRGPESGPAVLAPAPPFPGPPTPASPAPPAPAPAR